MDEGGSGLGFLAVILLVVFVIVAVAVVPRLLVDAAANRQAAESQARALELQAQTALEQQRATNDAERSERSHRQALEVLPYVALIVGAVVVLAVALGIGLPLALRVMRERPAVPQLPAPHVTYLILPGDGCRSRAEQWREIERQARRAGEVIIWQEEKEG